MADNIINVLDFKMDVGTKFSYVIRGLKENGWYEKQSTDMVKRKITPDMKCVDVGANIGYYSVMVGKLGCDITSYEPYSYNYELLIKNMKLNNIKKFHAGRFAVSDKEENLNLYINNECTGMSTLTKPRQQFESVIGITLSKYHKEIDFLKIDAEGWETQVLRGLGNVRPRYILVEDIPKLRIDAGCDPAEFYNLLDSYTMTKVDGNLWCELK